MKDRVANFLFAYHLSISYDPPPLIGQLQVMQRYIYNELIEVQSKWIISENFTAQRIFYAYSRNRIPLSAEWLFIFTRIFFIFYV